MEDLADRRVGLDDFGLEKTYVAHAGIINVYIDFFHRKISLVLL
jgi:hypothetical protein